MKYYIFLISLFFLSCQSKLDKTTEQEFFQLMNDVADGWSAQNTDLALGSFHEDAIYMEPPNIQYFRGHGELRQYFNALTEKHRMEFHNLGFNEKTQMGMGEFTFSYGTENATVGIAMVELKNGKIKFWREYQRTGPTDFSNFLAIENKDWKWHIGNYPNPTDNYKWVNAFNSNKDSLGKFYFEKAIKINATGKVINGKKAIVEDWKKIDWEIKNIAVLNNVETHQGTSYEYEIGEFKNSKDEIFKHLIIWNTKEKPKTRELELVAKVEIFSSHKNEIAERRKEWIALCNNHNAKKLVHELYAENAIYYNHRPVLIGRNLITKDYSYMNRENYQLTLTPIHLEEVTDSLAFEIGQCSGTYGGKYMIVWKKNNDGKWVVLMDSNI